MLYDNAPLFSILETSTIVSNKIQIEMKSEGGGQYFGKMVKYFSDSLRRKMCFYIFFYCSPETRLKIGYMCGKSKN